MAVRLSKCSIGNAEAEAAAAAIRSEFLGMGNEVKAFEESLQKFLATEASVICVNTGTSALHIALAALDIGPGDEVLVPSITFVASYQAISATGAKPISCEILPYNAFIDVEDAKKRLTSKTKAIMSVHYASDSSQQEIVNAFARQAGIRVVEDAAHSFGSRKRNGELTGCNGDIVCFSFDGIKNITCGEGGAVVTQDKVVIERVKDARLLGVEKDTDKRYSGQRSWKFDVRRQGFRYHMSNIMAAIGRVQLTRHEELFSKRKSRTQIYLNELKSTSGVELLKLDYNNIVPHIFSIKTKKRDQLKEFLQDKNIETGIHYMANHLLTYYKTNYSLPYAEAFAQETLTLPMHPDLTDEQILKVCQAIKEFSKSNY